MFRIYVISTWNTYYPLSRSISSVSIEGMNNLHYIVQEIKTQRINIFS